jgi:Phosphotransferase enzyme family
LPHHDGMEDEGEDGGASRIVELHLLIPDAERRHVLVEGEGSRFRLPTAERPAVEDWTRVGVARRHLLEAYGLDVPILETHLPTDDDGPEPRVPALVVCESPPGGWALPDGLRWVGLDGEPPDAADPLRPRLHDWLTEWRTNTPGPTLRPPWSRSGWFARASAWMKTELAAAGRPAQGPVQPVQLWALSGILRTDTSGGRVFLKAVPAFFSHEPAVTRLLAQAFPNDVPSVLAVEPAEGWLLLDDFGDLTVGESGNDDLWEDSLGRLVAMQRAFVGRGDDLLAFGCPERPMSALPDQLAEVLEHPPTLESGRSPSDRRRIVAAVAQLVAEIEDIEMPSTLVHGDFHPWNVALVDARPVIFDWSDAALGNPLCDLVTWFKEIKEPERRDRFWSAYIDAWAPMMAPDWLRDHRDAALTLGAAYQIISYVWLLRAVEPANHYQLEHGRREHLGRLEDGIAGAEA